MSSRRETRLHRLGLAFEAYAQHVSKGEAGSSEEFLAEHEDLRDLLEPMLEEEAHLPDTSRAAEHRVLGDFRVVREVGRGGMGTVYEAEQLSLGRRVALKVLPVGDVWNPRSMARFRREAEITAGLDHPGLVVVHAVGSENELFYYAMELVEGAPLNCVVDELRTDGLPGLTGAAVHGAVCAHLVRSSDPSLLAPRSAESTGGGPWGSHTEAAVEIVLQVAEALEHVHGAGVVHRDIKPGNILVRADGSVMLADFGLARAQDRPSVTASGEFAGTPHYASPEHVKGHEIDARSDVFSLGATLYELLTLRRPFDGDGTFEVLHRIQTADPIAPDRLNPHLAPDLSAIVTKALEKNPALRYQSAEGLAADLRAFLAYRPVAARRATTAARLRRWIRREPLKAAFGVSAALITGLALYVLSTQDAVAAGQTTLLERETEPLLATGFRHLGENDAGAAVAVFERVLGMAPDSTEAIAGMALAHLRGDDAEAAAAVLARYPSQLAASTGLQRLQHEALVELGREGSEAGPPESDAQTALDLFILGTRELDRAERRASAAAARRGLVLITRCRDLAGRPRALYDYARARAARLCRDRGEAEDVAYVLEKLWPESPHAWFWIGYMFDQLEPSRAVDAYRRSIALHETAPLYNNLGTALIESGDLDRAEQAFDRALELAPQFIEPRLNLALILQKRDRPDAAIGAFRAALEVEDTNADAWTSLGYLYSKKGELQPALDAYRRSLDLAPDDALTQHNVGNILWRMDRDEEALQAMRRAAQLRDDFFHAHEKAGLILLELRDYPEAEAELRRATQIDPARGGAQYKLGISLLRQNKVEQAEAALARAVELMPESAAAWENWGQSLLAVGRSADAVAALYRAEELYPDYREDHRRQFRSLLRRPQFRALGIRVFQELASAEPGDRWVHEQLEAGLRLAELHHEVRAELRRWLQTHPDDAEAWCSLACHLVDPELPPQWHEPRAAADAATQAERCDGPEQKWGQRARAAVQRAR